MVAAIVRAERVPAGGYASKRYATNDIWCQKHEIRTLKLQDNGIPD
jgi:hypothetical protein